MKHTYGSTMVMEAHVWRYHGDGRHQLSMEDGDHPHVQKSRALVVDFEQMSAVSWDKVMTSSVLESTLGSFMLLIIPCYKSS